MRDSNVTYSKGDIDKMEQNALTLRNVANQQLELIGRLKNKAVQASDLANKRIEGVANLKTRLITNKRKL